MENIKTLVYDDADAGSKFVADKIRNLIEARNKKKEKTVLGLATGTTPLKLYDELIRMHKEEGLSFANVITFNLDEYYPMQPKAIQSYHRFMHENLFNHIDIKKENIHIPAGDVDLSEVENLCQKYEEEIDKAGGIDIQLLGIGRTGHIGFNEPGSAVQSKTRIVTLDRITRRDAASDFFSEENVPRTAITMGVGSIFKARTVYLMAWGIGKASIIERTVEGSVSHQVPATFLQNHPDTTFIVDKAASDELARTKTPWLVGTCDWTEELTYNAVIWLAQHLKKPILKLTDEDYNKYSMGDLVSKAGSAYEINIKAFERIKYTITGWPGGKPGTEGQNRPERPSPQYKRAIIFSPHPDDDVISMGGTFIRLVDQGHEVHVAYQVSGNIAVHDDDVICYADFMQEAAEIIGMPKDKAEEFYNKVKTLFNKKEIGADDAAYVRQMKGAIRRMEAKAGCRYCGIPDENAHFMNLPFYETGKVKKNGIGEEDIKITMDLIRKIQPHQIYLAGDLADPHGTHKVCLDIIIESVNRLKGEKFMQDCYVWMYRGAWHEWPIHEIHMAVPLSPNEVTRKKMAIFKHQSQKDVPVFPGNDSREFWQRAKERNEETAHLYDVLGLPEYEAMEAFRRWNFQAGEVL
ncbi:MAG: glucosamine-6-phosphate deaminase [Bacteroidetes bacterium]|nr:glucosamine-6-phosphate deaminase [Bacteroidota bacterium]